MLPGRKQRCVYDDMILKVEVRSATELKKHSTGPGKRFVFCDHRNNPDGKLYAIARKVENVRPEPSHVEVHSHTVDSLWLILGDNDDLTGLKVEVTLGDKPHLLDSPASIYIPAGVNHTYRFIEGSGTYINVVAVPGGDYNRAIQ